MSGFLKLWVTIVAALLVIFTCNAPLSASCQEREQAECPANSPQVNPKEWKVASNRWQLTPGLADEKDTVSSEVRALRSASLSRLLQTASTSGAMIVDLDYGPSVNPVFDKKNHVVWIIGTFKSYRVYAAGPPSDLYTEINTQVDSVVFEPADVHIESGKLIDIVQLGGCLKASDGKLSESRVWPKRYWLQPGKRYVMALFPRAAGLFSLWSDWGIADGKLLTSSFVDEEQVNSGDSQLVGLSESAAIAFIRKTLEDH